MGLYNLPHLMTVNWFINQGETFANEAWQDKRQNEIFEKRRPTKTKRAARRRNLRSFSWFYLCSRTRVLWTEFILWKILHPFLFFFWNSLQPLSLPCSGGREYTSSWISEFHLISGFIATFLVCFLSPSIPSWTSSRGRGSFTQCGGAVPKQLSFE